MPSPEAMTADLLSTALANLSVRIRTNPPRSFSVDDYSRLLRQQWTSYQPDGSWTVGGFDLGVSDSRVSDALRSHVLTLLEEFVDGDRVQLASFAVHGGPTGGFDIEYLISQILRLGIMYGATRTADLVHDGVTDPDMPYSDNLLLSGVCIDSNRTVADRIRLIQLPSSVIDFPSFMPSSPMLRSQLETVAGGTILQLCCSAAPRFFNPASQCHNIRDMFAAINHYIPELDGDEFDVDDYLRALSLTARHTVGIGLRWSHVPADEITNVLGSGSVEFNDFEIGRERLSLDSATLRRAEDLYRALRSLDTSGLHRLRIPIDRLTGSTWPRTPTDRVIDLSIALECLYTDDDRGATSYKLQTRGAKHLGRDLSERRLIYAQLKELYRVRSKAVHAGSIPDEVRVDGSKMRINELLTQVTDLCLRAIMQFVRDGFPVWQEFDLG